MPFYIIAVLLILYTLFINGRKGFILFVAFSLFLNTNITLISIPGIPILALQDFLIVCYYLIWKFKDKKCRSRITSPWFTPYLIISFVMILSCPFSVAGFGAEITAAIKSIIGNALLVYLCWEYIDSEKDFSFLYKVVTIVFLISCIYGLFEYSIRTNPLSIYERTLNHDASKILDFTYAINAARGYRINSIFVHAIGAGCNWAMYVILTLCLFMRQKKKYVNVVSIITSVLCVICIILCKQRGPLLFLGLGVLSCVNFKSKKMMWLIFASMLGIYFVFPYLQENINIISSLFDKDVSVGGSSIAMRISQFDAAFHLLKDSPIFGLGSKFTQYISNQYTTAILGMESIWLTSSLMYGALGVLAYVFLAYYEIIKLPRFFKAKYIVFLSLAYWITASATTIPGFSVALYYSIFTIMYKSSEKYSKFDPNTRKVEWRIKGYRILRKRIYKK